MNYINKLYNASMYAKNNTKKFIEDLLELGSNPLDVYRIYKIIDNNKNVIETLSLEELTKTSDILRIATDASNLIDNILKDSLYNYIDYIEKKSCSIRSNLEKSLADVPTDVLKHIIEKREKNNK